MQKVDKYMQYRKNLNQAEMVEPEDILAIVYQMPLQAVPAVMMALRDTNVGP